MKPTRPYTMQSRADAVSQTRERIARTALQLLFEHAYEDITLSAFAKAAGVSHQTVLNHFESKEGVVLSVVELFSEQTIEARSKAQPGDVAGAVKALVGDYERIGDANFRWATTDGLGELAGVLDDARAHHQEWIETMFGELIPRSPAARRRAVHALHAATDVYTWKLLRRDLRLTRAETERIIVDLVVGVVEGNTP
jgi:AcrR family transcriptional regulator